MRADANPLRRLSQARVRLVIAFAATMTGEVLSRILHGAVPHWICATVVFAVALTQLYADLRYEKPSYVLFSAASVLALAALYIMSTNETVFSQPAAHMAGHMQMSGHSHAHMVCVATEFILIAKYFEKSARFSAAEMLAETRLPVPENETQSGETITVLRSEVFPVDGVIISGATVVDESAITGGRSRVSKTVGDTIYCGSVNYDHTVEVTASCNQTDSIYFRRLDAAYKSVTAGRTGLRKTTSRSAMLLLRLVIAGGLCAIALAAIIGEHGAHKTAMRVISVAIAATPAVVLSFSPMADLIAFSTLAKNGILFKDAASAEKLAHTGKIYLDKSALMHEEEQKRRQGADKTEEALQKLGYTLCDSPTEAIVVASWREAGSDAFTNSPLCVAIGKAAEMLDSNADVLITQDRITHLLRAVFVAGVLQRNLRMALTVALGCNALVIALAAVGLLTPVYAGIAAAVVTIGLLANNRLIEKRCKGITFEKLYKFAGVKKGKRI